MSSYEFSVVLCSFFFGVLRRRRRESGCENGDMSFRAGLLGLKTRWHCVRVCGVDVDVPRYCLCSYLWLAISNRLAIQAKSSRAKSGWSGGHAYLRESFSCCLIWIFRAESTAREVSWTCLDMPTRRMFFKLASVQGIIVNHRVYLSKAESRE